MVERPCSRDQQLAGFSALCADESGLLGSDLAEQQVELLARAVVSALGQEELHLLLNLLLVQVPAVFIVHAGPSRGVRGACACATHKALDYPLSKTLTGEQNNKICNLKFFSLNAI